MNESRRVYRVARLGKAFACSSKNYHANINIQKLKRFCWSFPVAGFEIDSPIASRAESIISQRYIPNRITGFEMSGLHEIITVNNVNFWYMYQYMYNSPSVI